MRVVRSPSVVAYHAQTMFRNVVKDFEIWEGSLDRGGVGVYRLGSHQT